MSDQKAKRAEAKTNAAVIVIDMISDFNFEDGDKLFPNALKIAPHVLQIKQYARESAIPFIFVNDRYGKWNGDPGNFIETIRKSNKMAEQMLDLIHPGADDLYVPKSQRSGFYKTDLEQTLERHSIGRVLIAGLTTDICVLFTAHDAYMRNLKVRVPKDCVAAVEDRFHTDALEFLERVVDADTSSWEQDPKI